MICTSGFSFPHSIVFPLTHVDRVDARVKGPKRYSAKIEMVESNGEALTSDSLKLLLRDKSFNQIRMQGTHLVPTASEPDLTYDPLAAAIIEQKLQRMNGVFAQKCVDGSCGCSSLSQISSFVLVPGFRDSRRSRQISATSSKSTFDSRRQLPQAAVGLVFFTATPIL